MTGPDRSGPAERLARFDRATAGLDPPFAVLDRAAARANLADLAARAVGPEGSATPIRLASKSVRSRAVIDLALGSPGFAGVMAYALREAIWLARGGVGDVLMGYPTADRGALAELAGDPAAGAQVTLMIDSIEQLDLLDRVAPDAAWRIVVDVDASLRIGPSGRALHLGVRRSPVRTPAEAAALARVAAARGHALRGLMFYEAQIAGLPDTNPVVRAIKRRSAAELATRRGAVAAAVGDAVGPLELINSGGTGSIEISRADPVVTEVTAGSGVYQPALFDGYRAFAGHPALYFALPVVRRPGPAVVTAFGGGYIASGPSGRSRLPRPVAAGLALLGTEGAGEVQTPLRGGGARALRIGDRVWLRPAKAGEVLERFDALHLVEGDTLVGTVPTYRGEGRTFG